MRFALPLLLLVALNLWGAKKNPQPIIEKPFTPQEAAKTMQVPKGFNVTLFAGEPDIKQPIAFCIDDRGRLWVAEANNYPDKKAGKKDRIIILEDTDGDGRHDKRIVFYDKLEYVSGIEVGFGGVWVMSIPNFYFIPDKDYDGVADGEPVVLDMAMTQSSIGRVRDAAADGEKVPLGWGLDSAGQPSDDPDEILSSGRLLPMGEHKGSALAFAIELLTAGLANGLLCGEQGVAGKPTDTEGGSTKLFIAIRPFGDWLPQRSEDLKAHLGSAPRAPAQGEAQWPGEGSFRRRREYLENGIALPLSLAQDLEKLARELGVEFSAIQ